MMDDQINESMAKDPAAYYKARHDPMSFERKVLSDVLEEWIHQRDLGFDLEHDLSHNDGVLSLAAAAYAIEQVHAEKHIHNRVESFDPYPPCGFDLWPFEASWWKPKKRRENLVRAAAFLLSEITRLDAENSGFGSEERP